MNERRSENESVLQAVLTCIASRPQGVPVAEILAHLSPAQRVACDTTIALASRTGWIEPSPIFLGRWRWARRWGPFGQASAWVRLRERARPFLADIHQTSGLPVTLHVLFGRAHAVIERVPDDPPGEIAKEVARYAVPRALDHGMTSKVFLAWLPDAYDQAALVTEQERDVIRRSGYGYAPASSAVSGGIVSAPVCAKDGTPIAALCTYGSLQMLSAERIGEIGPAMAGAAANLAVQSEADAMILRTPADALDPSS